MSQLRNLLTNKVIAHESFEMQGCDKFWQAIDVAQIHDRIAAIEAEE